MSSDKKIGIIGFGVMGAAIALSSAEAGYSVIFKELNDDLVNKLYDEKLVKPLKKKIEKGKINKEKVDMILSNITGTSDNKDIKECDLIIEAAIEDLTIKKNLFKELDSVCSKETIFVSNTSTFKIKDIMDGVSNQSRTAGLHYFFPANINKLVEVIYHENTDTRTIETLKKFVTNKNKIHILVKDFPGFAINPVFISSYSVLNSFYGEKCNIATLEEISKTVLGTKFGIMWVQNGSGLGTCYHAAKSMYDYLHDTDIGFPNIPKQLISQVEKNINWNLKDGNISDDSDLIEKIKERLLGSIFSISTHLVEKKIVSIKELELGIRSALAWNKGPFSMMNDFGMDKVKYFANECVKNGYFKMPKTFSSNTPKKWVL